MSATCAEVERNVESGMPVGSDARQEGIEGLFRSAQDGSTALFHFRTQFSLALSISQHTGAFPSNEFIEAVRHHAATSC
jgi:hypothetical protein